MKDVLNPLTRELEPLVNTINHHPLYQQLQNLQHLQFFMQEHVFAVWDFVCLLKELYRRLIVTKAPWTPPSDPVSARLISQILLEEESDLDHSGQHYLSHYEIYLQAMQKIGANTDAIKQFVSELSQGIQPDIALSHIPILPTTKQFVLTTFSFFSKTDHEIASAFVYGREGITSPLFSAIVNEISQQLTHQEQQQCDILFYYLKRHIDLDSNEHFPKATQMLGRLIADKPVRWQQAKTAATLALQSRISLLNGMAETLAAATTAVN